MDITYLVTGASTVEAARAKSRDGAQMLEFFESIGLLHELRELVSREKLFHSGLQWFGRNELHRQSNIGVDSRHPVLNISLDLGHADTNLLLEKFSHETYSSRTEMVDIIFRRAGSSIEMDDVRNDKNKVGERESTAFNLFRSFFNTKTIVESETSNARKIIAFFIKNGVHELTGILRCGQIAIAQTFVDFYSGFVESISVVFRQSLLDMMSSPRNIRKESENFVV